MEDIAASLVECLEEELRFHEGLRELGERKRDELVRLDSAAVEKTNREEQAVLVALGETAARRLRSSLDLAAKLQVPEEQATVRGLASRLPAEPRSRLFDLAQDLRRAITRVRRINESNRLLTEHSLKYVHDFFGILTGAPGGDATYGRGGRGAGRPGRLMIDQVI